MLNNVKTILFTLILTEYELKFSQNFKAWDLLINPEYSKVLKISFKLSELEKFSFNNFLNIPRFSLFLKLSELFK